MTSRALPARLVRILVAIALCGQLTISSSAARLSPLPAVLIQASADIGAQAMAPRIVTIRPSPRRLAHSMIILIALLVHQTHLRSLEPVPVENASDVVREPEKWRISDDDVKTLMKSDPHFADAVLRHPEDSDKLAKIYLLTEYFSNGGGSGYTVSDQGHSLEDVYRVRIEKILNLDSWYEKAKFVFDPDDFAVTAQAKLATGFANLQEQDRMKLQKFIDHPEEVVIGPMGAYMLVGGFSEFLHLALDESLASDSNDALLLRIHVSSQDIVFIRIDPNPSLNQFNVQSTGVGGPTLKAIEKYPLMDSGFAEEFKKKHPKLAARYGPAARSISMSLMNLRFMRAAIEMLAPSQLPKVCNSIPSLAKRKLNSAPIGSLRIVPFRLEIAA